MLILYQNCLQNWLHFINLMFEYNIVNVYIWQMCGTQIVEVEFTYVFLSNFFLPLVNLVWNLYRYSVLQKACVIVMCCTSSSVVGLKCRQHLFISRYTIIFISCLKMFSKSEEIVQKYYTKLYKNIRYFLKW